jgi:DNA-binding transcriptional LysR family regulator
VSGQTLFLRINRGLQLTAAGQTLRDARAEAQGLVHEAINGLGTDPHASALVVGAATSFASMVLAPGLNRFLAHSATTHLRILSSNEPAELDRMASNVQIRHYAPGAAPAHAVWLAKDLVLPVCAPGLIPLRPGEHALPAALAHQVLLRYETVVEGRTKIDWIRWLRANHQMQLRLRGVISFNHYDQLIEAAVSGCGIAMGRLPLVQRYLDSGSLIAPFGNTGIETGAWYAVLSNEASMAHRQREFLQWLQSELASSQN